MDTNEITPEDLVYMLKYDPNDNLPSWVKSITWTSSEQQPPPTMVWLPSGKAMMYDNGSWRELK